MKKELINTNPTQRTRKNIYKFQMVRPILAKVKSPHSEH
ncbi:hypothetical protein GARC_4293 [Paraglaciecola arctica BSs20135]|uniref:Uncharacterized protein n=1 Tax=Paraglaciecola arctica BSs20135 TaxID=493475 RepID=K6ZCT6_9ALTE|nr:hypothetical protein GARC_4293 [Paraglaciecola arctica BSs20135]